MRGDPKKKKKDNRPLGIFLTGSKSIRAQASISQQPRLSFR